MIEKLGGRKFILGMTLVVMGFVLVLTGRITADTFFSFAEVVGGTYVVGNVASKIATREQSPQE